MKRTGGIRRSDEAIITAQRSSSKPVENIGRAAQTLSGGTIMALIKVIEVLAESPNSWEEAAQTAVKEASASVRGIASVYVKEFEAKVENDQITSYRINAKITFAIEGR
jgi:flavin-binding protein dodecin